MPERLPAAITVLKLAGCCLLASVVATALTFPFAGGLGLMSNRASEVVANGSAQLLEGQVPAVSTMVDAKGNTIAWLYSQRRFEVPSDKIANTMKLAIVSIEDKRFADHSGVDWKGTLTGLAGYASGDLDTRGGSTLEQQYVKNYQLLVTAQTDAEKRAAVETTPARKLREIRMALTLDKTFTKSEILTRYLNLVSFGNNSFGVQDAAQTYFGINASDLNWQQAALLAGMVQSTSTLNPYTNPDGALARRNVVLDTMIENLPGEAEALRAAKAEPLGVLPQPNELPRGCIAAGDRAFFCDYVQEYLSRAGISKEQVATGGYLIRTTLDPEVQAPVKAAIDKYASPNLAGISSVMSVIKPGKDAHKVLAMASNRKYGLDLEAGETMRPQPFSLVGDGAGSIFKIFTTAAALDMGMGINAQLDVPPRFQAKGLGSGGAKGCPKETWCVVNAGNYRGSMNVTDALATSPNTAFAKLISQVGVGRAVDMAIKLGLRSYANPGTARDYNPDSNESLADFVKRQNLGSFTLGPIELNALELSNVAATLASGGVWCPPQPNRPAHRPQRQRSRGHHRDVRPGGARRAGEHPRQRDEQGRRGQRHGGRFGRRGGLGSADVRQNRHHRGAPVGRLRGLHQPLRGGELHLRRLQLADRSVFRPAAPLRQRRLVRRQRAIPHLVRRDEADRQQLRRSAATTDRSTLCRRRTRLTGTKRGRSGCRRRTPAPQGRGLPGRRPNQLGQQLRQVW
ncbi:murein polymerase [Mycobacterium tuberculosis]|nr:murein polymerase [Mycobacterium tuberculosis]